MSLRFTKMAGCGNDFVILDPAAAVAQGALVDLARAVCRPGSGVGADGLVAIHAAPAGRASYAVTIVNRSGLPAEMCGNAARCIARYAAERGLAGRSHVFLTAAGEVACEVKPETVRLELPDPSPLARDVAVDGHRLDAIDVGVPHAVLWRDDVETAPVASLGPALRHAAAFPDGANINFVALRDGRVRMRTFERGVEAETLACGTGAVASAISAAVRGLLKPPVEVITSHGGILAVDFRLDGKQARAVSLEGPTTYVFEGVLSDEWLAGSGLSAA